MPLNWLVYQQGDLRTRLIVKASFVGEARLRADVAMIPGVDQHFVEGHELDAPLAERDPRRCHRPHDDRGRRRQTDRAA